MDEKRERENTGLGQQILEISEVLTDRGTYLPPNEERAFYLLNAALHALYGDDKNASRCVRLAARAKLAG